MHESERLARARQRQAAAIAAKRTAPKPAPRQGGPIRLGASVQLTRREMVLDPKEGWVEYKPDAPVEDNAQ